jgi:hypothetical protein
VFFNAQYRTRTTNLTHLAVEHEMVLKYVQATVGEMAGPRLASRAYSYHSEPANRGGGGRATKSTSGSRPALSSDSPLTPYSI